MSYSVVSYLHEMYAVVDQLPRLGNANLSAIVYLQLCGFCSERFPLPLVLRMGCVFYCGTHWAFHIIISIRLGNLFWRNLPLNDSIFSRTYNQTNVMTTLVPSLYWIFFIIAGYEDNVQLLVRLDILFWSYLPLTDSNFSNRLIIRQML